MIVAILIWLAACACCVIAAASIREYRAARRWNAELRKKYGTNGSTR